MNFAFWIFVMAFFFAYLTTHYLLTKGLFFQL